MNYVWTVLAAWHDYGQEIHEVVAPNADEAHTKAEAYFTAMNDPGWKITSVIEGQAVVAHLTVQEKCSWAAEAMYAYAEGQNWLETMEWETMGEEALVAYHDTNCHSYLCPKES